MIDWASGYAVNTMSNGEIMMGTGVRGLWHLALKVTDLSRSRAFYEQLFGMQIVWQPDAGNIYLSSGSDNLALHQISASELAQYKDQRGQFMDHLGIIMESPAAVDRVFKQVEEAGYKIVKHPTRHRDDSYSFYVADPDGNTVQVLYDPTISSSQGKSPK